MATVSKIEVHEAAEAFPMMEPARFQELKNDIALHGQREPITLLQGKILDGRNRYRACVELGIEPETRPCVEQENPWEYVWSINGQRRDLSDDLRAQCFIFAEAGRQRWDKERERIASAANSKRSATQRGVSKAEAKERACTKSTTTLPESDRAKIRHAKAAAAGVNAGALAKAEALANKRPDLADKVRRGEIKPAEARRQAKRDEVSTKATALPDGKFAVIYADPPWEYGDGRTGDLITATGALHHYPTMPLGDLKALDIVGLSADDCALFLWVTSPLLPDGLDLCRAWGFTYKASFIWDKVKHNLGHYNSVRHELLLIATRGSGTPQVGKLFDSVQSIERSEKHSEKPAEFRNIIETLYPEGARVELFARQSHEGWKAWGNEC